MFLSAEHGLVCFKASRPSAFGLYPLTASCTQHLKAFHSIFSSSSFFESILLFPRYSLLVFPANHTASASLAPFTLGQESRTPTTTLHITSQHPASLFHVVEHCRDLIDRWPNIYLPYAKRYIIMEDKYVGLILAVTSTLAIGMEFLSL
jgi:hypothetical protein